MITSGISRLGGKYRLRKTLLSFTPKHDFFLSLFLGSGVYEINKPRCKYECFNDLDSELINYFLIIREYPLEFDNLKKGIFGLVSQEIFERIVSGKLQPKNDIERAYFFYYTNKLAHASSKGDNYRGITTKHMFDNPSLSFQGLGVKTNRPYTNNDCGLLTPLDSKTIERLRYVNITNYPFDKCYKMFEKTLLKHNIIDKAFIYLDPPYPLEKDSSNDYYSHKFLPGDHQKVIEICQNTKFRFMLSIGSDCQFYLDSLSNFIIKKVKVKYSTNVNYQQDRIEYLIMNYDIKKIPQMKEDYKQSLLSQYLN
jgi:DNA adenine methylase